MKEPSRLTMIEADVGRSRSGKRIGRYRCACGAEVDVIVASVVSGGTRSCGCYNRESNIARSRARAYPRRPLADRFWEKVDKNGPVVRPELGRCWVWTGGRVPFGHGVFLVRTIRGTRKAILEGSHRVAWRLFKGGISEGMQVLHKCDNPPCCNPEHLFEGTQLDNMRDMVAKGRNAPAEKTRHVGSAHGRAKLTESQIPEIRQRIARGESKASIARVFGVSDTLIFCIATGKNWTHVKESTTA